MSTDEPNIITNKEMTELEIEEPSTQESQTTRYETDNPYEIETDDKNEHNTIEINIQNQQNEIQLSGCRQINGKISAIDVLEHYYILSKNTSRKYWKNFKANHPNTVVYYEKLKPVYGKRKVMTECIEMSDIQLLLDSISPSIKPPQNTYVKTNTNHEYAASNNNDLLIRLQQLETQFQEYKLLNAKQETTLAQMNTVLINTIQKFITSGINIKDITQ